MLFAGGANAAVSCRAARHASPRAAGGTTHANRPGSARAVTTCGGAGDAAEYRAGHQAGTAQVVLVELQIPLLQRILA